MGKTDTTIKLSQKLYDQVSSLAVEHGERNVDQFATRMIIGGIRELEKKQGGRSGMSVNTIMAILTVVGIAIGIVYVLVFEK